MLLAVAAGAAVADWIAVARDDTRLEHVFKPATLLALIAVAVTLDPILETRRWLFVAALSCSLVGDVLLMLEGDRFVAGLVAFLGAHVAYLAGFAVGGLDPAALGIAVVLVGAFGAFLAVPILSAVDDARLRVGVATYMVALGAMAVTAAATQHPLAASGAALFVASDTVLGWNRFVAELRWAPVTIMVAYHLGQSLLVLSLLS